MVIDAVAAAADAAVVVVAVADPLVHVVADIVLALLHSVYVRSYS